MQTLVERACNSTVPPQCRIAQEYYYMAAGEPAGGGQGGAAR